MNCHEVRKNLAAYTENELLLAERGALEQHLNACPSCARELEKVRKIWPALKTWKPIEPSDRLKTRVMSGLYRRRTFFRIALPLAAAAAVALVVLSVLFLFPAGSSTAPLTAEEMEIVRNLDVLVAMDDAELMDLVEDDQSLAQLEKLLEAEGFF